MEGEEGVKNSFQFSSSTADNGLNLVRLRDRVKDYIEKVLILLYNL